MCNGQVVSATNIIHVEKGRDSILKLYFRLLLFHPDVNSNATISTRVDTVAVSFCGGPGMVPEVTSKG